MTGKEAYRAFAAADALVTLSRETTGDLRVATTTILILPEEARKDLRVVAAAVLWVDTIYALPPPARHHDVIHTLHDARQWWSEQKIQPLNHSEFEQGFLLNNGRFASRRAAAHIALLNGQVEKIAHLRHGLFSEDLW